ncbi:hypothetical protein [Nocardia wallacei]|uniref:hypothetical protein n=1 Tax=Nocardia wallacei TaxID=480035 RepID=UPI002456F7B9|nr:hypothetical protein [Nocardia wallacei]
MSKDDIRAEAVERIANVIRSKHWCTDLDDGLGGYECCCGDSWGFPTFDGCQTRHNAARTAAEYVDALGDIFPIATEESYIGRSTRRRWRYVTGWVEEVAK